MCYLVDPQTGAFGMMWVALGKGLSSGDERFAVEGDRGTPSLSLPLSFPAVRWILFSTQYSINERTEAPKCQVDYLRDSSELWNTN